MKRLTFFITIVCMCITACINQGEQETSPSNNLQSGLPEPGGKIPNQPIDPVKMNELPSDPLEGIDTILKINPEHGEPGHRCDVPVCAEISTMPKTIGMSLCKTNK